MEHGTDFRQQQIVDLDKGLFWVHYKSADQADFPPKLVVSPAPGHERKTEFILDPVVDEPVLWQPGSSLILKIGSPAKILVQVVPLRPYGSTAVSVKFEKLTQGTPRRSESASDGLAFDSDERGPGLRMLGHVAGMGDVVVSSNEWIAGPMTPARIEGISIRWQEKPKDVELRYAVRSSVQNNTPKMTDLETYAGTRGRALPITGIVLEMSGPGAEKHQFVAEAMFLSAPSLRAVGQRIVLAGPTGREPLVGLRIAIETAEICTEPASPTLSAIARKSPPSPQEKVRILRGKTKPASAICGAKTISGKPCQAHALSGKKRCHIHAGAPALSRRIVNSASSTSPARAPFSFTAIRSSRTPRPHRSQ